MPEKARLRINGNGHVEVELVAAFLADLNHAYASISVFIAEIDALNKADWGFVFYSARMRDYGILRYNPFFREVLTDEMIAASVPRSQQLVLDAVKLSSPGAWDFLGSLNPLEVGRKYLCDRHERRKDKQYRESAEERRMALENMKLENEVLADRIRMAKEMGVTESDLAPLLNNLIHKPLARLDRYQDKGVIEDAKLLPPRDQKPGQG